MDPTALADAGGWAVVVAMIVAAGISFQRGWVVPRFVYDREVARGDKLETQLDRMTESLERLNDDIQWNLRDRQRIPDIRRD